MLNQQTTDQLRALKLTGMLEAWEQQREQPQTHDLSFDERLALLVEREVLHRENRRLARLLKAAKLRVNACVEDIDYRHPRDWTKARMAALARATGSARRTTCASPAPPAAARPGSPARWATSPPGPGSVRYCACPPCSSSCASPTAIGSWPRLMNRLLKMELLILDDWGLQKITAAQRQDLMERSMGGPDSTVGRSTLIDQQLPTEHWHRLHRRWPPWSDAILDRLLHGAHGLELRGESMRKPPSS